MYTLPHSFLPQLAFNLIPHALYIYNNYTRFYVILKYTTSHTGIESYNNAILNYLFSISDS